jgi:Ca2+-binding EF-hand superfamily protein
LRHCGFTGAGRRLFTFLTVATQPPESRFMLTDFQKKKLGRLFTVLDSDHNNQLERNDYTAVVSNIARIHGWKAGSKEYSAIESLYLTIWGNLKALADVNNDGQVSLEEFLEFHTQMLSTPDMYEQITVGTADLLFEAFDRNHDEHLSHDDYRDFLDAYGIRDQAAVNEAFKKLDVTGKGRISKQETLERVKEFYFSNDENAAGNWLFGRYN